MTQHRATLTELEMHGDFIRRHIGPSDVDIEKMLSELGCTSVDDLISQVVPANIVSERALELDPPRSERAASTHLRHMRHRNQVFVSMMHIDKSQVHENDQLGVWAGFVYRRELELVVFVPSSSNLSSLEFSHLD